MFCNFCFGKNELSKQIWIEDGDTFRQGFSVISFEHDFSPTVFMAVASDRFVLPFIQWFGVDRSVPKCPKLSSTKGAVSRVALLKKMLVLPFSTFFLLIGFKHVWLRILLGWVIPAPKGSPHSD